MMAFLSGSPKLQSVQLCSLCHEPDHQASSCALASLSQSNKRPTGSKPLARQHSPPSDGKPQLCISWNQGACMFPGSCRYRHECGSCGEPHIARDCSMTPEDSIYKRPPKKAPARVSFSKWPPVVPQGYSQVIIAAKGHLRMHIYSAVIEFLNYLNHPHIS